MNETLRLGTIAGVRVGVNWSVLVIVWLLLVGLSAGRFPLLYPGLTGLVYASAGLAAAVAFLLSLLAHELAHAVVARHHGIVVEGITLWMFGGVAKLEGEARDPGADLRIAGVGPLVSLVLGLGFGLLRLFASRAGIEGLTLGVLSWLAVVNVVLAVFNLVPAAPLDGGRILRALLWRRHGDRVRAAVTAARAGRRFGLSLVMVGIVLVVFTGQLGGLWFALIGWLALINLLLAGFNLVPAAPLDGGRILRALLWRWHGDRHRAAVAASRSGRHFGILLVALGIVSLILVGDIGGLWLVLIGWFISSAANAEEQHTRMRSSMDGVPIADVMTADPATVPTGITVAQLVDEHVLPRRHSAFPVVDRDGRLCGLVTLHRLKQVPWEQRGQITVDRIACPAADVPQVAADDPFIDALATMSTSADNRLVVVDDGRVVGIVSPTDIARELQLSELRGGRRGTPAAR